MAKTLILLKSAILPTSNLQAKIEPNAEAMKKADRKLIKKSERSKIGDSLDLDEAFRQAYPQENRWDYLLSVPTSSRIVGVEPHSAKDGEVSVVIAKKRSSTLRLQGHLIPQQRIAAWIWVASGTVEFSIMDRARRQLAQNGITFAGRMVSSL